MVVVGLALAGFAGLGALTGVVLRAVFTKRRHGVERFANVPLLALAVFLMWAFLPVLFALVDVRELATSDELFVITTFALPVAIIGAAGVLLHRVRPRVLTSTRAAPLIEPEGAVAAPRAADRIELPPRTLPTPF